MLHRIASSFFTVATLLASSSAHAYEYGMAGCGVGSLLFGDDESFIMQSLASTTNNFYLTQSFSITSGTSNCDATGKPIVAQRRFLELNLASVAKEAARGEGEVLVAYGETFGCDEAAMPLFKAGLKRSYDRIFSRPGVGQILDATHAELRALPEVRGGCTHVF